MLTTHPRTPTPEAASTQLSATTVWPSRAPPGPSGHGCQQLLSSMSPSHPRPRAIRGLLQPEWGWWRWREEPPHWLSQSWVTRQHCTPGMGVGVGEGGVGGWHSPKILCTGVVWIDISFCPLVLLIRPQVRLMYKGMFRVDCSHVRYFQSHCLFFVRKIYKQKRNLQTGQ
jgi:hypothetical protein